MSHSLKNNILLIDDLRTEEFVNKKFKVQVTEVARDFVTGIIKLKRTKFDLLILDHDLGDIDKDGREQTGYDVLVWLEKNKQYLPRKIVLVTSNPVGRQKMESLINKLYNESENT